MISDDRRGIYSSGSYLPGKVNTETEYEMRLRVIKEKHEERLEAITDKVRVIYDNIRRDEVISTMRSDPTSSIFISHRMKEICDNHLAQEREETIDRLTEDVAISQAELRKIDKELRELKHTFETTHESFHHERLRLQNCEQENKMLRAKIGNYSRGFEELQKKSTVPSEISRRSDSELEKYKENLSAMEKNLWQKTSENEVLAHELENYKEKYAIMMTEVGKLTTEIKDRERISRESLEVITGLKEDLNSVRKERDELKNRHSSYGMQFKDIIDTEEKTHGELVKELNATHKEKSSRFKKKIIEQKKIIQVLENELAVAREVAESSKQGHERSLIVAQEDLKKVKEQWEKRCRELEKEHSLHFSEIQAKHQGQIAELQRHYQDLLEEKIKDFQSDHSSQFSRQKALDYELKRMMDEKILQLEKDFISLTKHESILNEETSKLRIKHLQEIREIEEKCNKELIARIKDIKEQNIQDLDRLTNKIAAFENERADLIIAKRNLESELKFSNEKSENLAYKVNEQKKEFGDYETTRKDLQKKYEEAQLTISKLKLQIEDEVSKKKSLEAVLESEKNRFIDLHESLQEKDRDFTFKQQTENLSFQEQISMYEEALAKEQQKAKRVLSDLEHYQSLVVQLEKEIEEMKEMQSIESQNFFNSSQRIKQEENLKYEKEIEAHLETKRLLIQAEHKSKFLASELESNEKLGNDLRILTGKYEKEMSEMRRNIANLESQLGQSEKVAMKLKKELEMSKEEESSVRIINKQALKESLDKFKERDN